MMASCFVYANGDGASALRSGWLLWCPELPAQHQISDPVGTVERATGAPYPWQAIKGPTVRTVAQRHQAAGWRLIAVVAVETEYDPLKGLLDKLGRCAEALATLEVIQAASAERYEDRRHGIY